MHYKSINWIMLLKNNFFPSENLRVKIDHRKFSTIYSTPYPLPIMGENLQFLFFFIKQHLSNNNETDSLERQLAERDTLIFLIKNSTFLSNLVQLSFQFLKFVGSETDRDEKFRSIVAIRINIYAD
ncbi:hypothetical protein BpHYR1_030755 [Brachionus plicatilis]|uniref:Uncharacterized protein n=1 Tax=Brachionus plicatilis TaxID=10195 RepID=A0A3M7PHZ6_BRAPC|nr:hypothetical protein BpHYR1_030755 [Brachionus plicatilis]